MSQWVKEQQLIEDLKPRVLPFGLPYTNMIDNVKKRQRDLAIKKAKINDKINPKPKGTREKTKSIHWLDY